MTDRSGESLAMRRIDRRDGASEGIAKFFEDVREQQIMKMNLYIPLLTAVAAQPDQYPISLSAGIEAGVNTKFADVELVWKIDGDFGLVGDRMHLCLLCKSPCKLGPRNPRGVDLSQLPRGGAD